MEKKTGTGIRPIKDLRDWISKLDQLGQMKRIKTEVNWNQEIGAICRAVLVKEGPALLFENIKDHQRSWCTKLFFGGFSTYERLALLLGLPGTASPKELIQHYRKKISTGIKPVLVKDGPVKENIITGDKVDLYQIPAPRWHHLDGGRYIDTCCGVVTKDPETGMVNVGTYRGMIVDRNRIGKLLVLGQHWGEHYAKHKLMGTPMPVAIFYGWDEAINCVACVPVPHGTGLSEYDMAGSIRGEPVPLVKCETVDLEVPASAEIVVEGYIDVDPATYAMEGPFGEYTGWYGGGAGIRPVLKVQCITHRDDPIYRGTVEGVRPGSPNEHCRLFAVGKSAVAWNYLELAGVPGVTDVWNWPVSGGTNFYVQIRKRFRGHAKQVASSLWGCGGAEYDYKHVVVVEEDIDIRNPDDLEWALAYRVNAGAGDVLIYGPTRGNCLDPSTRRDERDAILYGTGKWHRMLIDATRNWDFPRWEDWDNQVYPPVNKLAVEDEKLIRDRWKEYGLGLDYLTEEQREKLTMEKLMKVLPVIGKR